MKNRKKRIVLIQILSITILVLLRFCYAGEEDLSPRPIKWLLKHSDTIVLAKCVDNQADPNAPMSQMRVLSFKVEKTLKPNKSMKLFKLQVDRRRFYSQINHGKPVLLFLNKNTEGKLNLLYAFDKDGGKKDGLQRLVSIIDQYEKIITLRKKYIKERKSLIFKGLEYEDGTIVKQSAAIDLAELIKNFGTSVKFTKVEIAQISKTLMNSKDPKVAFPLCHVLNNLGDKALYDGCVYTIIEMDATKAGVYELSPIVKKRILLRTKLIEKALKERDEVKLYRIINPLAITKMPYTLPALKKIWQENKEAQKVIRFYLEKSGHFTKEECEKYFQGIDIKNIQKEDQNSKEEKDISTNTLESNCFQGIKAKEKTDKQIPAFPKPQSDKKDQSKNQKTAKETSTIFIITAMIGTSLFLFYVIWLRIKKRA